MDRSLKVPIVRISGICWAFGMAFICLNPTLVRTKKIPLYVGGLFELTDHWWSKYANFFPTVIEHAFEDVRNSSDILQDYELKLVTKDTKGQGGLAARRLTELVQEDPKKVAIIGPGLSDELTITGQIAPFYKITEWMDELNALKGASMKLSYSATTASTTDKTLFPTLFKVNQVMSALNPLRLAMMKVFGWSRVGTISYQDDMSESQMNQFHEILRAWNMTLVTSAVVSEASGIETIIRRFKAYRQGLYGDSHVWILAGPYMYPGWISNLKDTSDLGCSKRDLILASNGHFTLDYVKVSTADTPTQFGKLPSEIMATFEEMVSKTPYRLSTSIGLLYDASVALALGLNNSIKHLRDKGLSLADYNHTDDYLSAILQGLHELSFMGVSGPVAFDDDGQRIGITYIQQNFNDSRTAVAVYDSLSDNLTWFVALKSLWEDGTVPEDRFTYEVFQARSSLAAVIVVVAICVIGCSLAFVFLGFNIYNRNKRCIKMSSPKLNNVIICGCLLMYVVVLLRAVDYLYLTDKNTANKLCMMSAWVMSLGFTTLFGTLFSKTYRVYAIFRESKHQQKPIKDYHLFGVVGLMLVADCIILVPWSAVHPLERKELAQNTKDHVNHNIIYSEVYYYCDNVYEQYWFATVYIYKGLVLAFGTFLAWETRNVKIAALNDSKLIGFCIYNVVVVCVFGVPLDHALPIEQTTSTFLLESGLIMYCTTACLCILFIPKIRAMKKVQGKFFMSDVNPSISGHGTNVGTDNPSNTKLGSKSIEELETENTQLRMQLADEAIAMAKLKKSILQETGDVHFYKSGPGYVVFRREHDAKHLNLREDISRDISSPTIMA